MAKHTAGLEVKAQDISETLRGFFRSVLVSGDVRAILLPLRLPVKNTVMPVLVSDPERLKDADPLAPAFPLNSARMVSRLTRRPAGEKTAVVLRPCEIRAFVELVKLNQGKTDEIVIIGMDCPGAYNNRDYFRFVAENGTEATAKFCRDMLSGKKTGADNLSSACKACEFPVPDGADLLIGLFGLDTEKHIMIQALTPKGESLFGKLGLSESEEPKERQAALESLIAGRKVYRDKMFAETAEAVNSPDKLSAYLANCINCYNCRVACPVCYCKECVFVTDVFDHEPSQYLKWAVRKGAVKMPADTLFYHLTRLAHMSTACVGCGQCSNACPNDIHVAELFRTVAHRTQKAFDYEAGRSLEEPPPLSVFREAEFSEIVGIK